MKSGYSIVIPCFNESKRIAALMAGLKKFTGEWDTAFEIIFVDDGSKDDTVSLIENDPLFQQLKSGGKAKLIKCNKNYGKGNALREGVLASEYEFILTLDADLAGHPLELKKWLGPKKKKPDNNTIYIGSRVQKESVITDRKFRKFVGFVFNLFVQLLSPIRVRDSQCGFKLYPAGVAKNLFGKLKTKGWAHDVELLYRASLENIEVKEMPITWRAVEGSKLSIGGDSLKMFLQLIWINGLLLPEYFFVEPVKALRGKPENKDAIFRLPFILISLFLLFIMPMLSFHYGITGDEKIQDDYGRQVYDYLFNDGKITLDPNTGIQFYGGLFDFLANWFAKIFSSLDHFEARHVLNSLFGAVAIIFTGLFAKKIWNWRAGLLALLMASLSPRIFGEAMNNPKDIPYAMANICALYFMYAFITQLPKPSYRTVLFLILSIGAAIGVRVGGILLIMYTGLFTLVYIFQNKELKSLYFSNGSKGLPRLILYGLIIGVFAYLTGLVAWPYGLENPLTNPLNALKVMSNYFVNLRILFNGDSIWNNHVPPSYVPVWMSVTTPLLVLSGFILFIASFFVFKKRPTFFSYFMLLFTVFFPILYVIYKKSELHDGMRHFYFVSLSMIVCASLGWTYLQESFSQKGIRWAVTGILAIGLFLPFRFMFANHPNEYVYFNEIQGGIKGAYAKFETDYYMNSAKQAAKWLKANENLSRRNGKKVIIASNMVNPVYHYFLPDTANVTVAYLRWNDRCEKDWDYAILYSRFITRKELENGVWPTEQTIHTISADDVPLSIIVKRTDKSDMEGLKAMKANDFDTAITLFESYLKKYPKNNVVWMNLGLAYANKGRAQESVNALNQCLQLSPDNINALYMLAQIYKGVGDQSRAQYYMQEVERLNAQ